MSPILTGLLILLCASAGLYLCFRSVFAVPDRCRRIRDGSSLPKTEQYAPHREEIARMLRAAYAIPYEDVWIDSFDGLRLHGKYYATAPGAPVQIMFHGYHSSGELDFTGGLLTAAAGGYNVLLVDQRAHGKSEGKYLTFGILERQDCLAWARYASERFGGDCKLVLFGMSMGAATVLMAAALPLPSNVVGIVADSGYSSPGGIIRKVARDHHDPAELIYPLIRLAGLLYGRFDLDSASAAQAMRQCRIPVLLIHGEDDRFVPCDMSRECYALCAARQKRLMTVPGAGHGLSFMVDRAAYQKELAEFLDSVGCGRRGESLAAVRATVL